MRPAGLGAAGRWVLCGCEIISSPCLRGKGQTLKDQPPPASLQGCDRLQTRLDIQCVLGELPNVCISGCLLLVGVNASFQAWFPPKPEFFAVLGVFIFFPPLCFLSSFSIQCLSKNTAEVLGAHTKPAFYT